jgi:hypothetical protein
MKNEDATLSSLLLFVFVFPTAVYALLTLSLLFKQVFIPSNLYQFQIPHLKFFHYFIKCRFSFLFSFIMYDQLPAPSADANPVRRIIPLEPACKRLQPLANQ